VFKHFEGYCVETKGVYLHRVNGTPTHVHLAVNIEPFVTISDLAPDLKGGCSYDLNKQHGQKVLEWQRGFGVVSFGNLNLPWVVEYIDRQKEHHAAGCTVERLERSESDDGYEADA
jgi:putative transposase